MDTNSSKACKKALTLCNYMLHTKEDAYVHKEKLNILIYMQDDNEEETIKAAVDVTRYIRNNFDNLIGENVLQDVEKLVKK